MSLRRNKPRTCAILPIKPFDDAKERLSTGLDAKQRKLIAEAMVRDVFAALADSRELDGVVVISAEPAIAEIAGDLATEIISDERTGHSDAARRGVEWALEHDYDRVVTNLCLRRAHPKKKRSRWAPLLNLAGLTGLEPATSSVTGWHSNRLSYNPMLWCFTIAGGR